jgi:hypothetical protein
VSPSAHSFRLMIIFLLNIFPIGRASSRSMRSSRHRCKRKDLTPRWLGKRGTGCQRCRKLQHQRR